jgi:beta-aspartyl-dipeptidase (metallo-type)
MFVLIEHGDILAPEPLGEGPLLAAGGTIAHTGAGGAAIRFRDLARLDLPITTLDATDCWIVPGLVDPHAHLIGAGGEQGPASRQPEMTFEELVRAGVTTVAGLLGSDSTTRTLPGLLGKVRELEARGLTAWMYTGAMASPGPTLTGSVLSDLVLIDKVIGVGEVAISDRRSTHATLEVLRRVVGEAHLGGMTSGKAGVTHFHLGDGPRGMDVLFELLDKTDSVPESIYPTHITRNPRVLEQAAVLAGRGCFVDTDVMEQETAGHVLAYLERGGAPERLTCSSDAHTPGGDAALLLKTLGMLAEKVPLEVALRFFTENPSAALKLSGKGKIAVGKDADLLVLKKATLELVHVVAGGRVLLCDGRLAENGS